MNLDQGPFLTMPTGGCHKGWHPCSMVSPLRRSEETTQGTKWGKTPKERESDECRHQGYFCSSGPRERPQGPQSRCLWAFLRGLGGCLAPDKSRACFSLFAGFSTTVLNTEHTCPGTDEVLEAKHAGIGFFLCVCSRTPTHCHKDPSQLQGSHSLPQLH